MFWMVLKLRFAKLALFSLLYAKRHFIELRVFPYPFFSALCQLILHTSAISLIVM